MTILPSHHYQFSALLTALASLSLVVLVYRKGVNQRLKRQFVFYYASLFVWSLSVFVCTSVYDYRISYFFNQSTHAAAIMIPVFFLHFTLVYLGRLKNMIEKVVLLFFYLSALFFELVVIFFSDLFFSGIEPKLSFPLFPTAGVLYTPWVATFTAAVMIAHLILFLELLSSKGVRKKQIAFFLIANLLGYTGGIGCFLPVYNIPYFPFPYGPYGVLLLSLVSGYTILKHRFIDLEILIKKTIIFGTLFAAIFAIFSFLLLIFQGFLSHYMSSNPFLQTAVSILVIVLIYDPLRKLLIDVTDRYLFQKRYDYKKLLKDAAAGISQIKSLNQLLSLVIHFITMRVRVRNASILVHDEGNNYFKLAYYRGYSKSGWLKAGHIFNEDDFLIQYLNQERTSLDIDRLKEMLERDQSKEQKRDQNNRYNYKAIKNRMDELQAACCVPSFLGNKLLGILVLGEKKSGDYYSDEDLAVLFTIAQESAIAIENARLYDEAIHRSEQLEIKSNELQAKSDELLGKTVELGRKNVELEYKKEELQAKSNQLQSKTDELEAINKKMEETQSELLRALNETELTNKRLKETQTQLLQEKKRALLAGISAAVGHEIRNPLTPMIGHTYFLIKRIEEAQKLYYESLAVKLTEPERQRFLSTFSELHSRFSAMQKLEDRIKGIVSTLINLVKERTGKKEEVQLYLVIQAALEEVRFQTYWESLTIPEIIVDIPPDLPFISGITQDLQGVFVNLIINSLHALENKMNKEIKIQGQLDENNPKIIKIDFSDNGSGIPKELQEKIFEHGFTTKGEKGTGIGLFYCKDNIERIHEGSLNVRSEPGVGTCFTIRLPIYDGPSKTSGGLADYGNTAHR